MKNLFALMAGGPLMKHAPDGAEGASGDGGAGNNPPPSDFDKGYGKGVSKGQRELLESLGVKTLDEAKALKAMADAAADQKRKADEENGEFQKLYNTTRQELDGLKPEHATYKAAFESTMATLTKDLKDEDKALLGGLPPDKALALAQRLSAGAQRPPVGAPPGGTGTPPGSQGSGHDLAWYSEKVKKAGGVAGLTKEERADMEALLAAGSPTIGDMRARIAPK